MTSLEVLTLNCWALKPVSKFRAQRIDAIARNLASSTQYDIVCLQELWLVQDYDIVCKAVRHSLPYTKFFFTGALGSGLAIFSKHPLLSSLTIPYHLTGRPLGFGDFFVNKSAGSVVIEHPSLGEIEIFTTHMHAGGPEGYELGNSYRSTQAWRLSNEMRRAASQGRYVVTCGDFNFEDHELPYSILRDHGLVEDAWLASRVGLRPAVIPSETPELAVTEAGMTVDSPLNTWTHGKNIPLEVQRKFGKRLDYIFTRAPSPPSRWASYLRSSSSKDSSAPLSPALVCTEAEVVMRQLVPGEIYSISDHFGLRAKFILEDATGSSSTSRNDTEQPRTLVSTNDSSTASSDGSSTSSSTPLREMRSLSQTQHTLTSLFTLVQHHRAVHTKHFKQLLILFPSGILLFLALTTSSAFIPDRASFSPIFVFFSGLVGFATCVALIVGFVWGRWEEGGLKRVEAELEEELNRLSRTRL